MNDELTYFVRILILAFLAVMFDNRIAGELASKQQKSGIPLYSKASMDSSVHHETDVRCTRYLTFRWLISFCNSLCTDARFCERYILQHHHQVILQLSPSTWPPKPVFLQLSILARRNSIANAEQSKLIFSIFFLFM